MEYCLNTNKSRARLFFCSSTALLLGVVFFCVLLLLIGAVVDECRRLNNVIVPVLISLAPGLSIIATCSFFVWLGGSYYWSHSRRFAMDKDGITLVYCNAKTVVFSWDQIADICICDVNHNYGGGFDTVIRLDLNTDINGPLNPIKQYDHTGYERWRNGLYLLSHYKDVIYLDYSDQRFLDLLTACKKEIIDRRTKSGKSYCIKFWDKKTEDR